MSVEDLDGSALLASASFASARHQRHADKAYSDADLEKSDISSRRVIAQGQYAGGFRRENHLRQPTVIKRHGNVGSVEIGGVTRPERILKTRRLRPKVPRRHTTATGVSKSRRALARRRRRPTPT